MKLYEPFLTIVAILAGLALFSIVATKVFKLKDDNIAEELIENVIEDQTGLDIDLSPSSPEKS